MTREMELTILSQTCLALENFSSNGIQKDVYNVVKNHDFKLALGGLDFKKYKISAKLYYDIEADQEVAAIKTAPLNFRVDIDPTGKRCTLECQITVLCTQHEDMLFKIRVYAMDFSGTEIASVESHTIRCVSKPYQALRKEKRRTAKRPVKEISAESVGETKKLKKEESEDDKESSYLLQTISQMQREQKEMMNKILEKVSVSNPNQSSFLNTRPVSEPLPTNPAESFEHNLRALLYSYKLLCNTTTSDQRLSLLQSGILTKLSAVDSEILSELVGLMCGAGYSETSEVADSPNVNEDSYNTVCSKEPALLPESPFSDTPDHLTECFFSATEFNIFEHVSPLSIASDVSTPESYHCDLSPSYAGDRDVL